MKRQSPPTVPSPMSCDDARTLVQKFFDAQTTLADEQRLYAFFGTAQSLPADLTALRPLFAGFGAAALSGIEPPLRLSRPRRWPRFAVAAAVAGLLLGSAVQAWRVWDMHRFEAAYAGSYTVVNGQRTDDLRRLRPLIRQTLARAEHTEQLAAQTASVVTAENALLQHIADPAIRRHIQQLLND